VKTSKPEHSTGKPGRLHYIDWLRVLATLGVFLFHAVHPFDLFAWEIKNADQSMVVSLLVAFLTPWGMPLFFLIAGAGSWFSLQRRTWRQYATERFKRLLIPFLMGAILLSPVQFHLEWRHETQRGLFAGSLLEFFASFDTTLGPRVFGAPVGYHLWFLGFLFSYSLVALPLFVWLKRDPGRRFIAWLGRRSERRGGLLLFILPLVLVQFVVRPMYPAEHDWADFFYLLVFFVSGYILYADQRFARAIRRDWRVALILGAIGFLSGLAIFVAVAPEWADTPGIPGFYLFWSLWSVTGWCWTIVMLYVGMRFLDFRNKWLQYGLQAMVPFFLFHQPIIIVIAFFVVQWDAGIVVKLPVVVLGSFVVTLALYEVLVRRIEPLRLLLGLKPSKTGAKAQSHTSE
jgi:glucan biosynthesis protein C